MKSKIILFLLFIATSAFYLVGWNTGAVATTDYKIYDLMLSSSTKTPSSTATVVVEIDDESLNAFGQWPWPRVLTAELLKKITASMPATTSFDLIFPEQDRTSPVLLNDFYHNFFNLETAISGLPDVLKDNDKIFANAMKNHNIVLPVFFDNKASTRDECLIDSSLSIQQQPMFKDLYHSPYLLCNLPELQNRAKAVGHIQASPDKDGILRRLPLFIEHKDMLIPALGIASIRSIDPDIRLEQTSLLKNINVHISNHDFISDQQTNVLLRFYPQKWYRTISAVDVLRGNFDPDLFQGKFVFIGATAMGLHDRYTLTDGTLRPGVFAHATLVENIFHDTLIVQPPVLKSVNMFISFLFSLTLMVLMFQKKFIQMLVLFLTVAIMSIVISIIFIQLNIYISIGYFILPLITYLFFLGLILFVNNYRDRKLFFEEISKANAAMIESMALVAETRDTDTGAHIIRTKTYIKLLASHLASKNIYKDILTAEYIQNIYHAAPLHDVGKVGIPDHILKKNGSLTEDEFNIMMTHPLLGKELIANAILAYQATPMLSIAYNIAYYHHEKWDGSGYPCGLKGDTIPLEARLMALADVYDALISKRCYKPSFTFKYAEDIIIEGRGIHFDPALVDAFIALKKEFEIIANTI